MSLHTILIQAYTPLATLKWLFTTSSFRRGNEASLKIKALSIQVYRWASLPRQSWLPDCIILLVIEVVALGALGFLTNHTPAVADEFIHLQKIIDLSRDSFVFQWNPRAFAGYVPSIGFSWANYAPPALFISLGLDPVGVLNAIFIGYFLAFGPSVYYFGRTVGAERIVAIPLSILSWTTIGYLGYLGGGTYDRLFTLPLMFVALALTYRYVALQNAGGASSRLYWLLLITWFVTLLGDVYISAVPVAIAIPFVLLSAGSNRLRSGFLRLAVILLPNLALTAWFWIPLLAHVLSVASPRSDLTVSLISEVFWVGPVLSLVTFLFQRKLNRPLGTEQAAMLISLNLVSIYFLIMGAITPLWPLLPRIWSTYDSFDILSFLFPATLACLFGWSNPLKRTVRTRYSAIILVILVIINAVPTVALNRPPNSSSLNAALVQALDHNFVASNDYRVSLQGRFLTRIFPFYFPQLYQAGGRTLGLDPNPYYQSWYQTEAFFKDDLASLNDVYIEDQPTFDVTRLVGDQQNFASTAYWLDWYGVNTLVLERAFYPVNRTAEGYSQRGALFTTKTVETDFGPLVFVSPVNPGPILIATNSTTLGFYSQQVDSMDNYHALLALLSYLGLDSKYLVPVYLSTLKGIDSSSIKTIITDQTTYNAQITSLTSVQSTGVRIIPIPPTLLTQLQGQGPAGTVSLLNLISPAVPIRTQNLTLANTLPSQTLTLSSSEWSLGNSQNANVQLQNSQGNLTVTATISDQTKPAQFSLKVTLPNPVVLSDQLTASIVVYSDVTSHVGLEFTSDNFTSNFVESNHEFNQSQWTSLKVPFTNFTQWANPQSKFAVANGFTLSMTIPAGPKTASILLTPASIFEPSYKKYKTPLVLSLADAGFLQAPEVPGSTTILSNEAGGMIGTYQRGNGVSTDILSLGAFDSTAEENLTEAFVFGGDWGSAAIWGSASIAPWTSLESNWVTNENLVIQSVPRGFESLVWKETFTNNWNILATGSSTTAIPLSYFYAGPGVVYIPTDGRLPNRITISYREIMFSVVIPSLSAGSLAPLIVFRRRIYQLGTKPSDASQQTSPGIRTDVRLEGRFTCHKIFRRRC